MGIVAGLIVLIVAALVVLRLTQSPAPAGGSDQPVSATVFQALTGISAGEWNRVGSGTDQNLLVPIRGQPLLGPHGRPEVMYVGAEFCPFCAAERWSMILALSRFGTWSGLKTARSASDDVYPSTPTFTFVDTTYQSQYLDFSPVELTTSQKVGGQYQPLQTPTAQQSQAFRAYDAPPYVASQSAGAIPFVDLGNAYMLNGSTYSPALLDGKSWDEISASLKDPNSELGKAIIGGANLLTAAICETTSDQPADVCGQSSIKTIEQTLAAKPVPK